MLLGHEPDVEEAHHLPELHRRALHRPQRGDDLLGGLQVAALERLVAALLGAGEVGRARAELTRRLAGRQAGDASRCARAARSGSGPSPSARRMAGPPAAAAYGVGTGVGAACVAAGRRGRRGVGVALGTGCVGGRGRRRGGRGVLLAASRWPSASASASVRRRLLAAEQARAAVAGRPSRRAASSETVTTPAAMTNASSAGDQRDLQPRPRAACRLRAGRTGRRRAWTARRRAGARRQRLEALRPLTARADRARDRGSRRPTGSKRRTAAPVPRAARHARRDRAHGLDRLAQRPRTPAPRSPGVIAVAKIVPRSQIIGTTVAATTAAAAEISSVWIERPPPLFCSGSLGHHHSR